MPKDALLPDYQAELLDLALQAATAIPIEPHIKTRSRMQEAVFVAALELDQPNRAAKYVDEIGDWRRGAGFADLAFYAAEHGHNVAAEQYLELARRVSDGIDEAMNQGWRKERIRAKIAKTYYKLGRAEEAASFEANVPSHQSGELTDVKAALVDEKATEDQIAALEPVLATGDFDQVRVALETYAQLLGRFYEHDDLRASLEEKIKNSWGKLPVMVRVELMSKLVECALAHGDRKHAHSLLEETRVILDSAQRSPEYLIAQRARIAALCHRAGDSARARDEADATLAMYLAERARIVDIYRAGALRPLAEAYRAMGDLRAAREVYAMAIDEGAENPNSRPRAEDLVATCCSMAQQSVEPDAELWARIRSIRDALGAPW